MASCDSGGWQVPRPAGWVGSCTQRGVGALSPSPCALPCASLTFSCSPVVSFMIHRSSSKSTAFLKSSGGGSGEPPTCSQPGTSVGSLGSPPAAAFEEWGRGHLMWPTLNPGAWHQLSSLASELVVGHPAGVRKPEPVLGKNPSRT